MSQVDNVKKILQEINEISEFDDYAYEKILLSLTKIKQLPVFIDYLPAGTKIYRTRTHKDDILFKGISQLKNPDKKNVDKFARCNRPYQS